jgi:hypothetical protein
MVLKGPNFFFSSVMSNYFWNTCDLIWYWIWSYDVIESNVIECFYICICSEMWGSILKMVSILKFGWILKFILKWFNFKNGLNSKIGLNFENGLKTKKTCHFALGHNWATIKMGCHIRCCHVNLADVADDATSDAMSINLNAP